MKATFFVLALSAVATAAPLAVNAGVKAGVGAPAPAAVAVGAKADVNLKRGEGLLDVNVLDHSFNSRDLLDVKAKADVNVKRQGELVDADVKANVNLKRDEHGNLIDVNAINHSFNSRGEGLLGVNVLNDSFNSGEQKSDDSSSTPASTESVPCGCQETEEAKPEAEKKEGSNDDGDLITVNALNNSFNSRGLVDVNAIEHSFNSEAAKVPGL